MVTAERKPVDSKRFYHMTGQHFADQYYHIYNTRLQTVRHKLIEEASSRWPDVKHVPIEQLNASLGNNEVFVIGTLFKIMPKQPSILRELEENIRTPPDLTENFTSDQDSLVLHEVDENVQVVGDINVDEHVTGIPVCLRGYQLNGGAKFHVTDICYAGLDLSVASISKPNSNQSTLKGPCMLIVSGLEFGFDSFLTDDKKTRVINCLKKLRDFVSGSPILDDKGDQNGFDSYNKLKIDRVVIAGNSIAPGYTRAKRELLGGSQAKDNRTMSEVFSLFDQYLFTLAQSGIEIDIMPGKNDPTSFLMPQQPFHPRILPKSGVLENVHPQTNPCLVEHKGYVFLGTSGENVRAINQHTKIEASTTVLKHTLEWGHIAPSAPDNLSCVPFKDADPFIIDFIPDVYFAGNQPEYAVTSYKTGNKDKIQLISVPSFVETLSCVLVDLTTLDVDLLTFDNF